MEGRIKKKYENKNKEFPGFDNIDGPRKIEHSKLCEDIGNLMKERNEINHEKLKEKVMNFLNDKKFISTITYE